MKTFDLNLTHADANVLLALLRQRLDTIIALTGYANDEERAKEARLIRAMLSRINDKVSA